MLTATAFAFLSLWPTTVSRVSSVGSWPSDRLIFGYRDNNNDEEHVEHNAPSTRAQSWFDGKLPAARRPPTRAYGGRRSSHGMDGPTGWIFSQQESDTSAPLSGRGYLIMYPSSKKKRLIGVEAWQTNTRSHFFILVRVGMSYCLALLEQWWLKTQAGSFFFITTLSKREGKHREETSMS